MNIIAECGPLSLIFFTNYRYNCGGTYMNYSSPFPDTHIIEIFISEVSLRHGAQIVINTTLVSLMYRDGEPCPRAASEPSVIFDHVARRKRT